MFEKRMHITDIVTSVSGGVRSAVDVAQEYLNRIAERDKELHAFLLVNPEHALAEAAAVDERVRKGEEQLPLAGVPIAIKDNMCIAGTVTTAGSKMLANHIAAYDAFVVKKLRAAGAVLIGKTNMDEFAMGSSTENSAYGPTKNPIDTSRVPGGSSGGSAAAVAADMVPVALGSDTGGSIRQPAAFCGVVGLKPTYGSVSRSGLIAMASSLDQIGPLATSVADAETLFNVIRGKDPKDATSVVPRERPTKTVGWTVGVPKEYFADGLDPEIKKIIQNTIDLLEKNGAIIKDISLPHSPHALAVYYIIMPAEVSSNLARFDGLRYGYFESTGTLAGDYLKSRSNGFGKEARRRIILGTHVLSSGYYDEFYGRAQKVRTLIAQDFTTAFESVDVILTPTSPTLPFKFGEKTSDPLTMYLSDVYTVPVNLAGVPALSLPCGKVGNLPVGVQLIGKPFDEGTLFALGAEIERLTEKEG
mgnify:FL=1